MDCDIIFIYLILIFLLTIINHDDQLVAESKMYITQKNVWNTFKLHL